MQIVIDIVLPVFGLVLIGFAAATARWFGTDSSRGLSLFVFNFAIPGLLFRTMANVEVPAEIPWNFLLAYYLGTVAVFGLGMAAGGLAFGRRLDELGIFGLCTGFSNTILLGIPLILTALGEAAALPLFLLISCHGLLLMPLATMVIEAGRGGAGGLGRIPLNALSGLARNPIIVSLAAGLLFNWAGWTIPPAADDIIALLGASATPCALFAMGASLAHYRIAGDLVQSVSLVGIKTILHPLLVWLLAAFVFDLPPLWSHVVVIMAAVPTGINAYLFAQRYEICLRVSATVVLMANAFSILSLSVLLGLLGVR